MIYAIPFLMLLLSVMVFCVPRPTLEEWLAHRLSATDYPAYLARFQLDTRICGFATLIFAALILAFILLMAPSR